MMMEKTRERWVGRAQELRGKIARMEQEPTRVPVGVTWTYECPWLAGDLRVLATGFVGGT
jgi:hypothetical protein